MPLEEEQIRALFLAQLSQNELDRAVLYLSSALVAQGPLTISPLPIQVPWPAYLAFVDREPSANWGHSARFILLNPETREIFSIESRFPPFRGNETLRWRTIYKAASAPDWAVVAPND
jgi:hypothetical protein